MAELQGKPIGLVGLYDDPTTLLRAAEAVRDTGCRKWDCHTPYPVHGLDAAMGLGNSPVPYITVLSGFFGLAVAIVLTGGLSVFQYPLVTSGKALFSWQAFAPIYFELFILFAALATMGSVVFFCRLGKWHSPLHDSGIMPEVTCDRFAIVVDAADEKYDEAGLRKIFQETGCQDIRPLVDANGAGGVAPYQLPDSTPWWGGLIEKLLPRWSPFMYRATLVTLLALAVAVPLGMVAIPFIEFFNGMAAQPKGKTQMTYGRKFGVERIVLREPVDGTVPSNVPPEEYAYPLAHLAGTLDDAKRAGELIENPLPQTMENMARGRERFDIYCAVCHGTGGDGDGPVVGPNRFPAPPSLHTDQARGYADGTIFHIITKGTQIMPSYADKLTPEDRWKVIHYLRALQRANQPKPEDMNR